MAISPDTAKISAAFAEELGVTFPLLSDLDLAVIHAYGTYDPRTETSWPTTVVVNRAGEVAFVGSAANKNIDGRTPVAQMLKALDAL